MAINLGAAFVDIVPSTKNLARDLRREVDQPLQSAGSSAGQGFASRFSGAIGRGISGSVRALSDTLIGGVSAAATVAGGIFATSLVSGWSRFTTIEDSTRALTIVLGDATKAAELLDQVLGVVRGTPFNLDQFAQAAQRMVGMGIEAEKIPDYLTAIGEAAATQGRRANEFADRLATVFGQIAASGQVNLSDVWRISDTGVPALQILANEFGVTTTRMKKMIEEGAVPAGRALDALAKGIVEGSDGVAGATVAFGGTMAGLRETLTGAVGGFAAARARLGAAVIAPLGPALTRGFGAISRLLDQFGPQIGTAVANLVEQPAFERFIDWLDELPDKVNVLSVAADGLGDAFGPLLGIFTALGASGLAGPLRALGLALPGRALMVAIGAFTGLLAVSPELRDALAGLGEALAPLVALIADKLAGGLEAVTPLIAEGLTVAVEGLTTAVETVTPAVEALVGFLSGLGTDVKAAWEQDGLQGALEVLGTQLRGAWDSTIYPALADLGGRFGEWAAGLWTENLQPGIEGAWDNFTLWLTTDGPRRLLDSGLRLGDALVDWITSHGIPLGTAKITEFIDAIGTWMSSPENIQTLTKAGGLAALAIIAGLATVQNHLRGWALQLAWGLGQAVWDVIGAINEFFRKLGVGIVIAIANGIRESGPEIARAVGEALKPAQGWFNTLNNFLPGFGGFDIPGFDDGGVVPGRRGEPRLIVAHGGETVLPTHKAYTPPAGPAAGGGLNVEVNAPGITDPYTLADLTSQVIGWRVPRDGMVT